MKHTQQIAGKQPPLIPITLLGLKEKKISEKLIFVKKKHFYAQFILMSFRN